MKNSATTVDRRRFPRTEIDAQAKFPFHAYSLKRNIPEQLVGELIDYSAQGVGLKLISVQNPLNKGDFLYGIQFGRPDGEEISKAVGVVRSTDTVVDDGGHPYWRLGIELINIPGEQKPTVSNSEFPVRPQRYEIDETCEALTDVSFQIDQEQINAKLINASKFGVAFKIEKDAPLMLTIGRYLEGVEIKVDGETVYTGFLIIRNIRQNQKFLIIGCEVTGSLVDVDRIVENQKIIHYKSAIKENCISLNEIKQIPNDYKAIVADYRYFLEKFQNEFDRPYVNEAKDKVIKEVYPLFKSFMDEIYQKLHLAVRKLSLQDHELYKNYFQKQLLSLLLCSPFISHSFQKPYGYSGDFEMVLKVLDREIEGKNLLGKLLNMFVWNMDVTKAHRNRIDYLVKKIDEIVSKKSDAKILSIGSGPAREIKKFIDESRNKYECSFTLIDFDTRALNFSQEEILTSIKSARSEIKVEFINKSVRQIIKSKSCDFNAGKYDLVYCAGLFDYLSDSFCSRLLEIMASHLSDEGMLIATNVTDYNFYQYVMEFMGEWYLTHRSVDDMFKLASNLEQNWKMQLGVDLDETKVNVLLNAKKEKNAYLKAQGY